MPCKKSWQQRFRLEFDEILIYVKAAIMRVGDYLRIV
jgi:hypothetical protein